MPLIRTTRRTTAFATLALASAGVFALGVLPQQGGNLDLLTQANATLTGAVFGDGSGDSVAGAGDVNGDGRADVIIGAPDAGNNTRVASGSSYVVFGSATPVNIDLSTFTSAGTAGFRIDGAAAGDRSGDSVAGAGDVNGDGRADVIIGAPGAGNNTRVASGSSYVVYGSATPVNIHLLDFNLASAAGFRIDGDDANDASGYSVAGAGDVNGDGRADVIIGAYGASSNGLLSSGSSYVVFGSATPANIHLLAFNVPNAAGFRIAGATAGDNSGIAVAGAGDVNGDGRADVIIGARYAANNGLAWSGSSYVVFGPVTPANVNLSTFTSAGTAGFRIDGSAANVQSGRAVAGAGDVNGDGHADVIIGEPRADNNGRSISGSSYVVYGSASPVNITLSAFTSAGPAGFRIDGAAEGDRSGSSVGGVGDVNSDGRADVIIGAPYAGNNSRLLSGSSYVVYGSATPATLDLNAFAAPGARGFRIDGAHAFDRSGQSVSGAGDVNGDGRPDTLIGAPMSDGHPVSGTGQANVVYGFGTASVSYPGPVSAAAGTAITALRPVVARTGAASFSTSPALPSGIVLDGATGVISGTAAQAASGAVTVTMSDLTGQASTSVQVAITAAPVAAAPLPRLAGATRCTKRTCTTTGRAPRTTTRVTQTATTPTRATSRGATAATARPRRATGRCTITTRGTGRTATRTYRCTITPAKGKWTLTTTALTRTTPLARSVRTLTVR